MCFSDFFLVYYVGLIPRPQHTLCEACDNLNDEASKRYAIIRQQIKEQQQAGVVKSPWKNLDNTQKKELNEIIKLWKGASQEGHGPSQFNLGLMYREGRGVVKSASKAAQLYEMAANQNVPKAQFNLARLYHQGDINTYLYLFI
jgi:TPR repeat protein